MYLQGTTYLAGKIVWNRGVIAVLAFGGGAVMAHTIPPIQQAAMETARVLGIIAGWLVGG